MRILSRLHSRTLALALLVGVGSLTGCEGWETEVPTVEISASPYEDVYRGLSTAKFWSQTPVNVDISETVATVNVLLGSSIVTRAIAFADVDIQLKHHVGKDKWAVDILGSDGKLILRAESPSREHANELAMALITVQAALSAG